MKLVFFETPLFTRILPDYLDDEAYQQLQQALIARPEAGSVMRKAIQNELVARRQT